MKQALCSNSIKNKLEQILMYFWENSKCIKISLSSFQIINAWNFSHWFEGGAGCKGDCKIEQCLVVVEGGPGTLQTVYECIIGEIPVIIFNKTGRLANILADAYYKSEPPQDEDPRSYPILSEYIVQVFLWTFPSFANFPRKYSFLNLLI